ncbi:Eukaryotic translation initiation factor 3 subunit A [Rhizoctonia solani]|uniref:Eukaryotic translation initiation factor 3 subunit A n=1 Tax=Rhizoctonia solani TaxID=456999 RepID=A0A0K6FZF3_9AGAM|nr:Eukaryotic translation initiation factor 3 subunit A [Rhizoctonia solani]
MWPTFKTEHSFKETKVLPEDVRLATLAFGFTLGFGYFVVWHAIKQTHKIQRRSAYIIMCWVEIAACLVWAILSWLYITDSIGPSFWLFFSIVTIWSIQIQLLLQIIINRICILLPDSSQRHWLKFGVAAWIVLISISVYCIWIPAKLQISETWIRVNLYWDHTEKILYLFTDAALNIMFIRLIRQRLVSKGLTKYDKLVAMNSRMIFVSLSMDVVIIGMLSYRNDLVYMQFHPVAFMVKLEIEMCMSRLMIKVARSTGIELKEGQRNTPSHSAEAHTASGQGVSIHVTTQVITHTDNLGADYASSQGGEGRDDKVPPLYEADLEDQFHLNHRDPVAKDNDFHRDERHLDSSDLCCGFYMMPPRSKRKRTAAPARVTRSKAQAPRAPGDQTTTQGKLVNNGSGSGPGPSTRRKKPHLIMEVVLPASKRPTPKVSSAPSLDAPEPPAPMPASPKPSSSSPIRISEPVRESTPQVVAKGDNEKPSINELPPSSPPPMSSPVQEVKWDNSSQLIFSTPTPSPSRSRSRRPSKEASVHRPTPIKATAPAPAPQPSSPSAGVHPELKVVPPDHPPVQEEEANEHKPPTSPVPYSDTVAADDPFGFFASENRLRERRIQMGLENTEARPRMPSSGLSETFDQSIYEEAFASIFYDPQSGTLTALSESGSQQRSARASTEASLYDTDGNGAGTSKPKLKRKRTMEVVIPTKGKEKGKSKENQPVEEASKEAPPKSRSTRSGQKGKEKAKESTLTTYELEAMLPHRIRRTRKPRNEPENISLSGVDSDEPSSPPKKSKTASKKKPGRGATKPTKDSKPAKAGSSKVEKPTARQAKRVRGGEVVEMDDDTRKRFEAERERRLEAFKALDTYTLEEEEVV